MMYLNDLNVEKSLSSAILIRPSMPVTTTLNGTESLNSTSSTVQQLVGTAIGFSVVLPDATTLKQGQLYEIYNTSDKTISIKYFGGTSLFALSQTSIGYLYLLDNSTSLGVWSAWQIISNPDIASGIVNYKVTSSVEFSTSSTLDVIVTGLSVTPQAGTYAIWYNSSIRVTQNNAVMNTSLYRDGVLIPDSVRASQGVGNNWVGLSSTMSVIQFDGLQSLDARVRISSSSVYVLDRTLILIRTGS